jgi:pyruvate,water dikinase
MNIDPADRSRLGGKGFQLQRISSYCNVSPFFTLAFDDPEELMVSRNREIILERCSALGFQTMAVRSSANSEDSSGASFAGMFVSKLGVRPSGLIKAIEDVLDSVRGSRVRIYCGEHGIDPSSLQMSVVIQKMVRSRVSGVCFTRSDEHPQAVAVEACWGLGESLVSGGVTPDTCFVDRSTLGIVRTMTGYQEKRLILRDRGVVQETVPFYLRNAGKLSDEEVTGIARTALLLEGRLEFDALDMEWAFDEREFYVLQARPYTGFHRGSARRDE